MDQQDANDIMAKVNNEKDPVKVLDLVISAGDKAGLDIMEFYNNLVRERQPDESIETTFSRVTKSSSAEK